MFFCFFIVFQDKRAIIRIQFQLKVGVSMQVLVIGLFCLIVLWEGFITFNSHQVGQDSEARSRKSLAFVANVTQRIPTLLLRFLERIFFPLYPSLRSQSRSEFEHFLIRKAAHMTQFFILAILWLSFWHLQGIVWYNVLIYSLALTLLASVLDEFYQHFIPKRTASVIDVLVDFSGGLFASLIYAIFLFWV